MKTVGGESELAKERYNIYYTDSGRSSLRLILRSLKGKVIALPNYLCSVIIDVLIGENFEFVFYQVSKDFKIDLASINFSFDVLYIIDYFGIKHNYLSSNSIMNDKIVIEDNVFSPLIENTLSFRKWISFNSYRKFSFCAEGSMIKSTFNLERKYIKKTEAPFILDKYNAKHIKHRYINVGEYSEDQYLELFEKSEQILNKQSDIYSLSDLGIGNILNFNINMSIEKEIRESNYNILENEIKSNINRNINFKSFFVFSCKNRDNLKKILMKNNIFLPIHWPNPLNIENILYKHLLSVPVDSRYNEEDMNSIATIIKKYVIY